MENRRSRLVVDWSIQGRILGMVLGCILLTALVMGGFVWYCLSVLEQVNALYPRASQLMFEHSIYKMAILTGLGLAVVVIYAFLLAIRFSHRLVGPIFRIREELIEMRDRDELDLVYTRKNDFHKDLVRALNNFIINFRDRLEKPEE